MLDHLDTFDLTSQQLDTLPVGVITLDRRGCVLRYNETEAQYAHRSIESTIGKNFFTEIAPCTRVGDFQGRFAIFAETNDDGFERFAFTFPFRWGKREVEILFVRRKGTESIDIILTSRNRSTLDLDATVVPWHALSKQQPPQPVRVVSPMQATWHDDLLSGTARWSRELFAICEADVASPAPLGGTRAFAHVEDTTHIDELIRTAIDTRIAYSFEHRILTARGNLRFVYVDASVIVDVNGRAIAVDGRVTDITERRLREIDLWQHAHYDRLTGLFNRLHLETVFDDALDDTVNIGMKLAIIFIDLNRFKAINDAFGHATGDDVLQAVARRLERCVRKNDTVARLSGDEFVVFLSDFDDERIVEETCQRIAICFETPVEGGGRMHRLAASIGVSIFPKDGSTIDDLMHAADMAMYDSKSMHVHLAVHYNDDLVARRKEHATLENDLEAALRDAQFEMYYQPIVRSGSHAIVAAEALIRWNHPSRGTMLPGEFITLAETNGAIIAIGNWALREVCHFQRVTLDAGRRAYPISVNVSLVQFRTPGFVEVVRDALAASQIDAHLIVLELTESIASGNFYETMRTLTELKLLGVKLAIDDFGTGYSSLAYLKHFPIDFIKLDRAFVIDIARGPLDRAIADTIVALASKLGLDVIAEGVETLEQATCMEEIGCHRLQGYLFGHPEPAASLERLAKTAPTEEPYSAS